MQVLQMPETNLTNNVLQMPETNLTNNIRLRTKWDNNEFYLWENMASIIY